MTKNQKSWNWEAMAAIFVSLCALAVSVMQERSSQKHARLSVTPYLLTEVKEIRDSIWEMTLSNKGVGPAMIKKVEYEFEGKNYGERVEDLIVDLVKLDKFGNFTFGRVGETIFSSNETSILIQMTGKFVCNKLRENYPKVKLKITYGSIYEELWVNENNVIKKIKD